MHTTLRACRRALQRATDFSPQQPRSAFSTSTPCRVITRFWKKSVPVESEDGFRIELDGRKLKSPDGTEIVIPARFRSLAMLAAAEWEGQDKFLKASSLPITSLVSRGTNSLVDERVRTDLIEYLLRYLHTDTVCYHQEEPEALIELQKTYWDPLIEWVNKRFGTDIEKTYSLLSKKQSEASVEKLRAHLKTLSPIELAGFERAVLSSKSFIIPLCLTERAITVDFAERASRLEVLHQIARWGEVEDAHDVDVQAIKRDLSSATLAFHTFPQ
ncbi:ATP synthase complex assembly protein atp12 [Dinochytrium kinnereticum]|nr:ATP synthase complex assembly protein atp12 [Dinochytrium kinnereticum]